MMENPFEGLSEEVYELENVKDPKGNPLKIKPKPKDIAMFFIFRRGKDPEAEMQKVQKILVDMLKRTYPEASIADLETYIARNFGKIFEELSIFFGFTTREQIENIQADALKNLTGQ